MDADALVKKWFVKTSNGEFPDSDPEIMKRDIEVAIAHGRLDFQYMLDSADKENESLKAEVQRLERMVDALRSLSIREGK